MLRKLLGVVVALALPSLLAGQASRTSSPATAKPMLALTHGIATQVQGEVVMAEELDGPNNQEGVDEADGQNNDGQNDDGEFNQEGENEPDGLNNDVDVGEQVDQAGENQDEDTPPAPPAGTGPLGRIGRHKP